MWRTRMKAGQPCMVMPFCNSSTQENQETLSLKKKKSERKISWTVTAAWENRVAWIWVLRMEVVASASSSPTFLRATDDTDWVSSEKKKR
jgi:hypothetical protein